jgi:hypothetical protein
MELEFYEVSDLLEIKDKWLDLFKSCFGDKLKDPDQWYKWYNCSYNRNRVFCLNNEKGDIVASYGLYPLRYSVDNKVRKGFLCHNVMTHPSYTGRGIFTRIGQFALSKVMEEDSNSIVVGIPNENAIRGHLKIGWRELENIPFYEREVPDKSLNMNHEYENSIQEVNNFDKFDDKFIKDCNSGYRFHNDKDSGYLKWRFLDRPGVKYQIYKIENKGYFITKRYKSETENKLHVVEYAIKNNDQDVFAEMVTYCSDLAVKYKVDILNFWETNKKSQDTLLNNGFNKSDSSNRMILYGNLEPEDILGLSNWHICLGDNDVY